MALSEFYLPLKNSYEEEGDHESHDDEVSDQQRRFELFDWEDASVEEEAKYSKSTKGIG